MFFGAMKKQLSKKPVLIFDIGGTSVGAALVLVGDREPPLFVHSARQWLRPVREIRLARLAGLLETAIEAVGKEMFSIGAKRLAAAGYGSRLPATVHCFLTAPWYAPRTGRVRMSGERQFAVTEELLARAVLRERKEIEESIPEESDLKIMEHQIFSVSINGYETENPYGKDASDLEFFLYTALAEKQFLDRFQSRVARTFHTDDMETRSFLLAFFSCVRDIPGTDGDFLLVDVSGEVTEVSLAREGKLLESVSYPLGRNFLTRALAAESGVSCEEALSLLAVHFSSSGNEEFTRRFLPTLTRVEKEWLDSFEKGLSRIAGQVFLPHTTFVAADCAVAPWISSALQNEALYQYTLTAKPFIVNIADAKLFDPYVAFGPGVAKDPFLMAEALFVNKTRF